MSNFNFKVKDKKTGQILEAKALDDYYGKYNYGFEVGGIVFSQKELDFKFETCHLQSESNYSHVCNGCSMCKPEIQQPEKECNCGYEKGHSRVCPLFVETPPPFEQPEKEEKKIIGVDYAKDDHTIINPEPKEETWKPHCNLCGQEWKNPEPNEECGKLTVDAFGGNKHPCPISKPCWKHPEPSREWEEWVKVLANSKNPHDIDLLIAKIKVLLDSERTKAYEKGHTDGMELRKDYTEFNEDREKEIRQAERTALVEEWKHKLQQYKDYYNPIGDELNKGRHLACDDFINLLTEKAK